MRNRMTANEAGWLLALIWGFITVSMLLVGGVTGNLDLVLTSFLPMLLMFLCMFWAEDNA